VVQPHGAEFRFLYMRLVMNAEFGGDFRAPASSPNRMI
jgi:hypothetical protein